MNIFSGWHTEIIDDKKTYDHTPLFRACTVFSFGCFVEASQYFGYPIFGSTFDPFDILAYAGGVLLGILFDLVIFPRLIPSWQM